MRKRGEEAAIVAGVTNAAASSAGAGWTCTRTATGNYTFNFPGAHRAVLAFTSATSIGFIFISGGAGAATQSVVTNNSSNVAIDTAISFVAAVYY